MQWRKSSFGIFLSSAGAFDSVSSMVRNESPWGTFSEQEAAESHSERDPESTVVGWWQECFSRRGIAAQQAMCGSVGHRDAETTRNKLCTNKSHFQIVGQNRMNWSGRDANFLLQLHDGHSSITRNQLSHFFNQRNSGNFLTALRSLFYGSGLYSVEVPDGGWFKRKGPIATVGCWRRDTVIWQDGRYQAVGTADGISIHTGTSEFKSENLQLLGVCSFISVVTCILTFRNWVLFRNTVVWDVAPCWMMGITPTFIYMDPCIVNRI